MQANVEIGGDKQLGVIPASDRHSKDALARKAAELTANEFVRERILPLLNGSVADRPFTASVAQNTGTGRLALIYEFAPDCGVVAKLYTDELGPRSYAALQALERRLRAGLALPGSGAAGIPRRPQPAADAPGTGSADFRRHPRRQLHRPGRVLPGSGALAGGAPSFLAGNWPA